MMLTMISTPNWMAISTFCTRSDTTMPRALTQRHGDDEERSEQHLGEQVLGEVVEAEELEQVDRGDLGDVGQHDDRRHGQAPAADPADPRPERLGAPGERGAAVRRVLGQLLVGEGDQQHRDEREHEHRRRLLADRQHHVAQRGGQAVGGRDRGQADDDVADEAEGAGLQALVADGDGAGGSLIAMCGNIRFQWLLRGSNAEIVPYGRSFATKSVTTARGSRLGFMTASTRVDEFEELRPHLLAVAYRLTGTVADAEDIVQDAWLRWDRAGRGRSPICGRG